MCRGNALTLLIVALLLAPTAHAVPPYSGTIFIAPGIITSSDPTTFAGLTYTGQGLRVMFDRRVNAFVQYNAYLFDADYADGLSIEIQVNPEFTSVANAQAQAAYYAPVIGRLPKALRLDVETAWIHLGDEAFGGGNNNLLIHTGSFAQGYIADGILEETFAHEAAHTSLDAAHSASPGWLAAQGADPDFISTYAQDNPTREDIAESIVPWLAVRHAASRIDPSMAVTIENTIPNRLAYFDGLNLDVRPMNAARVFGSGFEGE